MVPFQAKPPEIVVDFPGFLPMLHAPHLRPRLQGDLSFLSASLGPAAHFQEEDLKQHCCLFGDSGTGKTSAALLILKDHLQKKGSFFAIESQDETVDLLLSVARHANVPEERVFLLSKGADRIPGWNPFTIEGVPPERAATAFVDMVRYLSGIGAWSSSMQALASDAAIVCAAYRLTIEEFAEILRNRKYREGILAGTPLSDSRAYRYSRERLLRNEPGDPDDAATVKAINVRIDTLLRSDFFYSLLCPPENTLNLASLWREQGVVIVHASSADLGDTESKTLAGMLVTYFNQVSKSRPGEKPVILSVDELKTVEAPAARRGRLWDRRAAGGSSRRLAAPVRPDSGFPGRAEAVIPSAAGCRAWRSGGTGRPARWIPSRGGASGCRARPPGHLWSAHSPSPGSGSSG
jgi:hypothetical protein